MTTKLLNKRRGHRAQSTKIINDVESELLKSEPCIDTLVVYSQELERQKAILVDYDDQICEILADEDIDEDVGESSGRIMKINLSLNKASKFIQSFTLPASNLEDRQSNRNVKLPQLTLIKFSGEPLEWLNFWDLFRTSVHERTDLPEPVKFQYLVGQLSGEASNLLSGFNHSASEYFEAIDLLKKTYGQKKILVQARLNALFDLEHPEATVHSLSDFRSKYEGHLRVLKSLELDTESSGYVYAHLLLRKLPPSTRDHLNRAKKTDVWDLENLRDAINEEIQHLSAMDDNTFKGNKCDSPNSKSLHSASFPIVSKKTVGSFSCQLCEKNHFVLNCDVYETPTKRKNRVIEQKLCLNCLKSNHFVSACLNSANCKKCGKRHHTSLCTAGDRKPPSTSGSAPAAPRETRDKHNIIKSSVSMASANNKIFQNEISIMPTANVNIKTCNRNFSCKTLLDIGSQKTFISKHVVDKLNLEKVGTVSLEVDGFGSVGRRVEYDLISVPIETDEGLITIVACSVNDMPNRICMPGRSTLVKSLKHKGHQLADDTSNNFCDDLSMLIGLDNYYKFVKGEKLTGNIYKIPSNLGTIVAGTLPGSGTSSTTTAVLHIGISSSEYQILDDELRNLWELDTIGIKNDTSDDDLAVLKFKESVKYENGKYSANLPWKDECNSKLPSNKAMAYKRLLSILQNLRNDETKLNHYNAVIQEQLKLDFIEVVKSDSEENSHYIPHHAVEKVSDTTPIRVVFDCSAKTNKKFLSLNDCLLTGPPLVNDLTSILLRFRLHELGSTSDLEKAFLMVGLNEKDRNYCKFFWPENVLDPKSKILTYRFKVVLFGSTASQFLLNCTIAHHLAQYAETTANELRNNIYVDNIICTFSKEDDLFRFYERAKAIMHEGGFNLREWSSNSMNFMSRIQDTDRCLKPVVKVLGVPWNTTSDVLQIKPYAPPSSPTITKRQIVSQLSKTFDPYGFLLPISVKGKQLLQDVWKLKIGWDVILPDDICAKWNEHAKDLSNVDLKIERKFSKLKNPALHVFADASTKSFGAVAYLVENNIVNFVIAKSRLVPTKPPSLPQLELTATNIAAKLAKYVQKTYQNDFEIKSTNIWSDSEITLHWICSSTLHKKPYVRQRVSNIHELVPNATFGFVKGIFNPADLLTRGITAKEFDRSEVWLRGPQWLSESVIENNSNFQSTNCSILCADVQCSISEARAVPVPSVIQAKDFSSYSKMLRVTSYVLRFIHNLKTKANLHSSSLLEGCLQPNETIEAELCLIKLDQRYHFLNIIDYLSVNNVKGAKPTLVRQLNLKMVNGLIRSCGRIENADVSYDTKYPILVSGESVFTKLLIGYVHEKSLHSGVNHVLSLMREKWWVPRGRQVVKGVIRKCVTCKKVIGKSYTCPPEAPLPADRLSECTPFHVTGVDYTGAISVKDGQNVIKAYIALFTCAVTRAIHLEVVYSLSEEDFLSSFIKFSSRCSFPQIMYSDNASNFTSASKTLKQISESSIIRDYFLENNVVWKFITPRAPWHGGMWERLIGLTKTTFRKMVGKALLSKADLETIIPQIEATLNNRPLTYISDDIRDVQPLTPSQLVRGYNLRLFPTSIDNDIINDPTFGSKDHLNKAFLRRSNLVKNFWLRWRHEYLTSLRERYSYKNNSTFPTTSGQVVLVYDETPRINWKMGVVTELFKGRDEHIRSVAVKTASGIIKRPVTKLYPLEIECDLDFVKIPDFPGRPKRDAAIRAAEKIKLL